MTVEFNPDDASRRGEGGRGRARRVRSSLLGLGVLAIVMLGDARLVEAAPIQAKVQGDQTAGFARVVFRFETMPGVTTRVSNGILVISFTEPVAVPIDRLTMTLSDYVAGARLDPDGKAVRLALSRKVTVNAMEAGQRLFIDLLPSGWKKAPPSLPQDVIDELNARAREAQRLEKEAAARLALARPKPIEVRAARQPTFTRLTFDLGDSVPVKVERSGNTVLLTFDAALQADIRMLKAQLPPRIEAIEASDTDARLTVRLDIADGSDVRAFWDGGSYVVDIAGGRKAASAGPEGAQSVAGELEAAMTASLGGGVTTLAAPVPAAPPPSRPAQLHPAGTPASPPAPAAAEPPDAAGTSQAAETASPRPDGKAAMPAAPEDLPSRAGDAQHAAPAAGAEPAAAPHPESKPAEIARPAPPPAPVPEPAPVPSPAPPALAAATDPVKPTVTLAGETIRLRFPFDRRTPGAVYRRGDNLWLVFDTLRPIDAGAIPEGAKDIVSSVAVTRTDGGSIVRLRLKKSPLTTMSPDGLGWIVSIGDDILAAAQPITLRRTVRPDGRTAVTAHVDGVGSVHRVADTDVGDTVTVVTSAAPARGFLKSQSFVEFRTLPTAHGLAFVPASDDLMVSVGLDDVTVSRDGGLTLSADGKALAAPAAEQRTALVDTARWSHEIEAPFQERERGLLAAAAGATDAERLGARMDLARFYLAKGFAVEAAAVLDVARAADKNAGHNPEFALLLAASRAMMGRGEETNQILEEFGLLASTDGALWQAVAEAASHHFAAAREAYHKGSAAVALYPKPLQAMFRLAAFESALEVGEVAEAAAERQAIAELRVELPQPGRLALLDARLAEAQDRKAEALEAYRRLAEGNDAIAAAQARLRAATLRRELGQMDDKGFIDELEILAATWRGDEVEAKTLRTLAEQFLKDGRDRQAFENMEVVLERFPKSETTRALQDRMQERFIALFLEDEARRLRPIDALALFYDHQALTPADRRGDEMIRKLADRLVAVDLLDQAADLLAYQIEQRLKGAGRAQVAAKLAMVHLMNRKPSQALQVLAGTRQTDLPRELVTARLIIEARALSESARPDLALEILDQLDPAETGTLRADVLWQARRWLEAGEAMERLLGESWQVAGPLTDEQRGRAMRAAIAYSLAEDRIGLDRLRSKFTAKMSDSADAASFEAVTAPIETRGTRFSDVAKQIAASDTLDAFLDSYRKRYVDPSADQVGPSVATQPAAAVEDTRPGGQG